jgi:hypothetical protein
MLVATSCKPNEACARCRAGFRRTLESIHQSGQPLARRFTHHVDGRFEDCESQVYEQVSFGAYEHKPVASDHA